MEAGTLAAMSPLTPEQLARERIDAILPIDETEATLDAQLLESSRLRQEVLAGVRGEVGNHRVD